MSQPQSVPVAPVAAKHYESPPHRDRGWSADRPADVFVDGQPRGDMFGSQGPDQGFVLRLARHLDGQLVLGAGEHRADVVAGCAAVALKRASLFGRGPTIHDLRAAYGIFGFLAPADPSVVAARRATFEEVHHHHHYAERRAIVDAVPAELLRLPHGQIAERADLGSILAGLGH